MIIRTATFAALAAVALFTPPLIAQDERALPATLADDQKQHLLKFLKEHSTPDRYVPTGAKLIDGTPPAAEVVATKEKPIKQYMVQVTAHRPVPDQPDPGRVDVVYYRPSPEKGKQGIAVKYSVDVRTGKQVGETEVLMKTHTPVSREELAEAVATVKEKAATVKALYEAREAKAVKWEYLQMKINKKSDKYEPGDRVVRFVFTVTPDEGETAPVPVRVIVNLTKDTILADER